MTALWHAHSTSHTVVLQRVRVCHAVIWLRVQPDMCVVGARATRAIVDFSISPPTRPGSRALRMHVLKGRVSCE